MGKAVVGFEQAAETAPDGAPELHPASGSTRAIKRLLCVGGALASLSACTTARTNQFKSFAELGRTFETAVDKVIDQASDLNVDADSKTLIIGRKSTPAERRAELTAHDEEIVKANQIYADLKKQNALLSEYFTALGALASFDGESAIGKSTEGLVGALQTLSPSLKSAKIGNAPIAAAVGAAAPIIISNIKSHRLEAELRRNGPIISDQLDLQSELLNALADDIASDQELLAQSQLLDRVYVPYAEAKDVPASWMADRREILRSQAVVAAPAAEAAKLSRKLKLAFVGLSEGRIEVSELADYAADLSRLMSLIEKIAKPANGAK